MNKISKDEVLYKVRLKSADYLIELFGKKGELILESTRLRKNIKATLSFLATPILRRVELFCRVYVDRRRLDGELMAFQVV